MLKHLNIYGGEFKKQIALIAILLIITDVFILLNVPLLREFLSITFFSIVPGFLILTILNLNRMEFFKKAVLTLGLSLSLLMFTGLFLNLFYPYLIMPLSIYPVIIALNAIILILILISLKRNIDKESNWDLNIHLQDKSLSLLIFPILLPFLVVIGTYLMNSIQYNVLIILILILIPIYIAFLLIFKNKVHKFTYPFSIWLISFSILLLHGLTSNHILGIDVHHEFFAYGLTTNNFYWDVTTNIKNAYYACVSITILPTIYSVLSGMNGEYVFKIVYAIIGSFVPLTAFLLFNKYFKADKAYLAALLIVFQNFFMLSLGCTRQLVALLFFFIAIYILFDTELSGKTKKALFLVSIFSIIISHYSTAYVALTVILPILLLPFIKDLLFKKRFNFKNFDIIALIFIFAIMWYGIFAGIQLAAGSGSVQKTIDASSSGLSPDARDASVLAILGIGIKSIPNFISIVANDLIFLLIIIGLIAVLFKFKYYKKRFDSGFILGSTIMVILLILFIIVPLISQLYGAPRLFLQSLIFVAPLFVIASDKIADLLKRPKASYLIMFALLVFLFSCSTYLNYHFYGMPYSPYYEKNGTLHNEYFILDQEVNGASWLNDNRNKDLWIYTDGIGHQRLMLGKIKYDDLNPYFYTTKNINQTGYLYLWNTNINKGTIYVELEKDRNIQNYTHLFSGKNLIYANGGCEIRGW